MDGDIYRQRGMVVNLDLLVTHLLDSGYLFHLVGAVAPPGILCGSMLGTLRDFVWI